MEAGMKENSLMERSLDVEKEYMLMGLYIQDNFKWERNTVTEKLSMHELEIYGTRGNGR
jgi:hypothetical protein